MAFLEGPTVSLRPVEESDLDFVQAGVNHPEVRPYIGQRVPTSLAQEAQFLEAVTDRDDAVQLLVETDDSPVGVVELDPIDREAGVADLAVWVHPDQQGHGYAREAVSLVCTYAFDELRLHKLTADAYAANAASRALFESLGFTQEGVGREDAFFDGAYQDSVYYGLLEDEWPRGDSGSGPEKADSQQ